MFSNILLVFLLSIDSFIVSVAYSIGKIKIKFIYVILISIFNALSILISSIINYFLSMYINFYTLKFICFMVLFLLGLYNIFQDYIKALFNKSNIRLLRIFSDETLADIDKSCNLELKESLFLAFVLSFDSLFGGFGINFVNNYILLVLFIFLLNILFISIGLNLGYKISNITSIKTSYITGILIIIISIINLLT